MNGVECFAIDAAWVGRGSEEYEIAYEWAVAFLTDHPETKYPELVAAYLRKTAK